MTSDYDEFYVGYLPEAPKKTGSFVKKVIAVAGVSVCIVAILLAWYQKKFSKNTFNYGINSKVEGYYFEKPIPHLAVPLGVTSDGKEIFQNVLLVGEGKAGAKDVMSRIRQNESKSLVGAKMELTGFMIYGNGKALLQVSLEDNTNLAFLSGTVSPNESIDSTDTRSVSGEIVDPKCYFGVMKPGEGKAHRSCAIRCIAGGIPPVLHASTSDEYFLIVNERWQPANEDVLALVGDQITLMGNEVIWNDWKILKVDTNELTTIAANKRVTEQLVLFESGMTFCFDPGGD